jgi:hypothetical protein
MAEDNLVREYVVKLDGSIEDHEEFVASIEDNEDAEIVVANDTSGYFTVTDDE